MAQLTIVTHHDSAAVVLPPSVLESMGLQIGDVLELTLGDQQLLLRPAEAAVRRQRIKEITRSVLEARRDAYERLA